MKLKKITDLLVSIDISPTTGFPSVVDDYLVREINRQMEIASPGAGSFATPSGSSSRNGRTNVLFSSNGKPVSELLQPIFLVIFTVFADTSLTYGDITIDESDLAAMFAADSNLTRRRGNKVFTRQGLSWRNFWRLPRH